MAFLFTLAPASFESCQGCVVLTGFVTGGIGLGHLTQVMSDLFLHHGVPISHFYW